MDLSVFPQLASDQSYTSGFYPELLQAIVRELSVIVLQNPGLRREFVGDRPLDISILDEPFSKRLKDIRAAVGREWRYGVSCEGETSMAVRGYKQMSVSSPLPFNSSGDSLGGKEGQPAFWQDGLMCGDPLGGTSSCQLYGCLSPWEQISKDLLIGITHVKFSTSLNSIAAVYRGEVHMTDVGTLASAYLPKRYNFLPLQEILEPSCTTGAWKSFFLWPPLSSRRRQRNSQAMENGRNAATGSKGSSHEHSTFNLPAVPLAEGDWRKLMAKELARGVRVSTGVSDQLKMDGAESAESWEERMNQIRKLFFQLYAIQEDDSLALNTRLNQRGTSLPEDGSSGSSSVRNSNAEPAYGGKTLLKLHHVDHFTFSYLFLQFL